MTNLSAYVRLAVRVAAPGEAEVVFETCDFGELPEVQPFRDVVIDTSYRRFIGWADGADRPFEVIDRSDGFVVYVEPRPLRRLGLWLLHVLFSGRNWAGLELTHPTSRARWLYVQIDRPAPPTGPLSAEGGFTYTAYEHWPQQVSRHPFAEPAMAGVERVAPADRPHFAFGWSKPDFSGEFHPRNADQIIWTLTPEGLCALASLFFDMGHQVFGQAEVDMEPPHVGFAATQARSLEARFWLPGSLGFYADSLDGVSLPPWPGEPPA